MTYTDYAGAARSARSQAASFSRRARKDAEFAAGQYEQAREYERHARWLTRHPDLWTADNSPARVEATAAVLVKVADTFARSVFEASEHAAHCRDLAREYDTLAAVRDQRLAREAS